jgi:tetratricopeptide (TPR) repeat protein
MSTASGITAEGGGKMHPALPRKQRGFRLAVVFAAVALCWGWSLNWASGRSFPGLQTMGVRLSEFGPFFLGAAVSLVCLGWASKLIWDRMAQSRSAARVAAHPQASTERKPWIASQELKAIATVLFSGTTLSVAVGFVSGDIAQAYARGTFLASGVVLWLVLISAFFNMLRSKAPDGNWRKIAPVLIAPPLIALAVTALVNDPGQAAPHNPLSWGLWITLASAILLLPATAIAGLLPVRLVEHGKFDLALRLNRLFFWTRGNTRSTEGWILIMAGRYAQARTYLKPLAFDKKGHPRLTTQEFFLYALALSLDGEDATAEMLYEAAVNVPQQTGDFHFGLADCLLTQKKETDRARQLVECVLAGYPANPRSAQQRANRAQMVAFHAWSLASNGWCDAAGTRLQEALAASSGLNKYSRAALQLPVGDTWLALGDSQKAQAAYRTALNIFPYGDIAIRAQKKLAILESR